MPLVSFLQDPDDANLKELTQHSDGIFGLVFLYELISLTSDQ